MSNNPNISRTFATFRVCGKHLYPEEVTRRLRIDPSESHNPGDKRGKSGIWPHGYWAIESGLHVQSTNLSLHIEWLLNRIEPVQVEVLSLVDEGFSVDIFCFLESLTGHGGPTFSPTLLRRVANLNVELSLDMYFAS
jgi:hypothetical protein